MIQTQTNLKAVDNSGARFVRCIKILKGFKGAIGKPGDIILVSIRDLRLARKVKKGEIHFGVIVRTSKESNYKDGSLTKFKTNSVILLNKKRRILGTRIFSPISKNLRQKKFIRLLLMAKNNII
jgi:large subunit ribosomal protein L14